MGVVTGGTATYLSTGTGTADLPMREAIYESLAAYLELKRSDTYADLRGAIRGMTDDAGPILDAPWASPDADFGTTVDRPFVVEGRLPLPGTTNEIAINEQAAREGLGKAAMIIRTHRRRQEHEEHRSPAAGGVWWLRPSTADSSQQSAGRQRICR